MKLFAMVLCLNFDRRSPRTHHARLRLGVREGPESHPPQTLRTLQEHKLTAKTFNEVSYGGLAVIQPSTAVHEDRVKNRGR